MRILLQGPRYACSLLSELNRCRLSRRYCDVLLQVGNRTFAAHRAVLSCAGAYFCDLFSRGTPDSSPSSPNATVFSLEFISPANFEKVLTFVYTGEILIDLIDVGVLYDLAERLGIGELVGACHATFPDLQTNCKSSPLHANSSNNDATACSSAASSSSLSSLTPASRDSPFPQSRSVRSSSVNLSFKLENAAGFGPGERRLPGPNVLHDAGELHCKIASVESTLQLKVEQDFSEAEDKRSEQVLPKLQSEGESPSSVAALGNLQVVSVQGAVDGDVYSRGEEGNGAMEAPEEDEQWRQLAGEIIELSDDETFLEEKEEDEDDDLVCVENGANPSVAEAEDLASCRVCGLKLPLDPGAVRVHAESHLTEGGQCVVCGLLFSDAETGLNHVLSHVGVQLFACAMCHSHFSSRAKLLRHMNRSSASYSLPPAALSNSAAAAAAAGSNCELQCGQCGKALCKDFQSVREHVLSHVSLSSLCCSVCQLPQSALCPLLWHGLSHTSVPAFTCPHCAMCFVERPLLDRHMSAHAEEAAAKERERSLLRAYTFSANGSDSAVSEELRCLFCPQTFTSSSAFHSHLSAHANDNTAHTSATAGGANGSLLLGKRKAQDPSLTTVTSQGSSSLPSLRDIGGLLKMSNVGFHKGFPGFSQSPGQDGAAKAKWYRCRYCGKSFAHSGEFTYHLRIHTGEKPYQCKVCLRFFRGRSTMICHLKTHAGAMMYRCTVCGLFFSTLKMVSSHMELHRDHLPPDFNIEQTFMYNDHSKEPLLPPADT